MAATARSFTIPNLTENTDYSVNVTATNSITESAGTISQIFSSGARAPTQTWTQVYHDDDTDSVDPFVLPTWTIPGDISRGMHNDTYKLELDNLPRHTYINYYIQGYSYQGNGAHVTVTVAGQQVIDKVYQSEGSFYAGSDGSTGLVSAIAHSGSKLTIEFKGQGFDTSALGFDLDYVWVSTYFPRVSVSTSPVAGIWKMENGSAGTAQFTASRTGQSEVFGEPMTIPVDVGGTATAGTDYQPITSITIPAGAASASVPMVPIDDNTPEWSETVQLKPKLSNFYAVSDPTAVAQCKIIDDDLHMSIDKTLLEIGTDRVPLHLVVPQDSLTNATVSLNAPQTRVRIYTAATGGLDVTNKTWTYDGEKPPATLYIEAIDGSSAVGDDVITLDDNDANALTPNNGDRATTNTVTVSGTGMGVVLKWQGNDVTGKIAGNVLVGQEVLPVAVVLGPPNLIGNPTFSWTIQGDTVYDYIANGSTGSVIATDTLGNLHVQAPQFYWVDAGVAGIAYKVQCDVNAGGQTFSKSTQFTVYAPVSSFNVVTGHTGRTRVGNVATNAHDAFVFGASTTVKSGMVFTGSVTMPGNWPADSGTWYVSQLITSSQYALINGVLRHRYFNGAAKLLDSGVQFLGKTHKTGESLNATNSDIFDTPGVPLLDPPGISWVQRDDMFDDYLMFVPPPNGASTIAVPLQHVQSDWGGAVYLNPNPVAPNFADDWPEDPAHPWYNSPAAAGGATHEFPVWTNAANANWEP